MLSKPPSLIKKSGTWVSRVWRSNELISPNLPIPINIDKLLFNNKDLILYNSNEFPMPQGITDIAIEKDEKKSRYMVSINFTADEKGRQLYKNYAQELCEKEGIILENKFAFGFAKISVDFKVFCKKIRAAGDGSADSPIRE